MWPGWGLVRGHLQRHPAYPQVHATRTLAARPSRRTCRVTLCSVSLEIFLVAVGTIVTAWAGWQAWRQRRENRPSPRMKVWQSASLPCDRGRPIAGAGEHRLYVEVTNKGGASVDVLGARIEVVNEDYEQDGQIVRRQRRTTPTPRREVEGFGSKGLFFDDADTWRKTVPAHGGVPPWILDLKKVRKHLSNGLKIDGKTRRFDGKIRVVLYLGHTDEPLVSKVIDIGNVKRPSIWTYGDPPTDKSAYWA